MRPGTIACAMIVALGLQCSFSVSAAPMRRFALLLGNNEGGPQTEPLRYAEADAKKLQQVLLELGGYHPNDIVTLFGANAGQTLRALDALEARVLGAERNGSTTSLMVYYSGHAKVGDLRLGKTRLSMHELRRRLKESQADIKIGIIDACESGAITRAKGGRRGPSFLFEVDDREATRGLILISSSSQNESSQESDEIGGSFFTHYLTSGLRGDADDSKDQRVTLGEVYEYTYNKTVEVTAGTRSGTQHPTYSFDLKGQGEVILTDISQGRTGLIFSAQLQGRFLVFDLGREQVAAEINKKAGTTRRIALPPGQYALKQRRPGHLRMSRFELLRDQTYAVDGTQMQRVAFEDDYAKGPILKAKYERLHPRKSYEAVIVHQRFLSSSARATLFPALTMIGVTSRRGPSLGGGHLQFDLLFGGQDNLSLDLGEVSVKQNFFEAQFAAALMWRTKMGPLLLGMGPRLASLYMRRSFPSDDVLGQRTQDMLAFSPAVAAEAQIFFGDRNSFVLGATGRSGILLYNVDDNRTLAYIEAGISVGYRP